jgi:hypothetical protein
MHKALGFLDYRMVTPYAQAIANSRYCCPHLRTTESPEPARARRAD